MGAVILNENCLKIDNSAFSISNFSVSFLALVFLFLPQFLHWSTEIIKSCLG